MVELIKFFRDISYQDIGKVGGKNASLGEMFNQLSKYGIRVPDGYATTAEAYWLFLDHNKVRDDLAAILRSLNEADFSNLTEVGYKARELILQVALPDEITRALEEGYSYLTSQYGNDISLAVRSSATAEDLPAASFAGQLETYLNVSGLPNLIKACHHSYASLFTDRAIKYRLDNGFDHMQVALSVGVQVMVRSDRACSGVMFTLDPDTGFKDAVVISGSWGLGENIVQGAVNTDEFTVFKPMLDKASLPIISHKLGSKAKTMVYAEHTARGMQHPAGAIINLDTPRERQVTFVLQDSEIMQLARWATIIEKHYRQPMDIEWAKDWATGDFYIVQARPETIYSQYKNQSFFTEYKLKGKGPVLCSGVGISNRIVSGVARVLSSPRELDKIKEGEVLVTHKTDPDWDPILKKAGAIITDQGGRTSHAAIVARELGAVGVLGTGYGTQAIKDGQVVTVSTAGGETGHVYEGKLEWEEQQIDLSTLAKPHTKAMLILGDPEQAFKYSFLPSDGVGLMRMEFIINNSIQIHPMALKHFDKVQDVHVREEIEKLTPNYSRKEDYFVDKLAEATAVIAAAFYPKHVIVRMSDFKSNEYANLIGGRQFEPDEANPMIGFRGASRYYHPLYQEGFELECRAMKKVREQMGLTNIKLMIPFCRTVEEGEKVVGLLAANGLTRGENGLEVYVMVEIPSNALLAEEFAQVFDGFSIGSNDLTQLTLGADRDSNLLSDIFTPFDPAVQQLIMMTLQKSKTAGTRTGLCGQAPSDYPAYASFLVQHGIDSISFNPDAFFRGVENMVKAEQELKQVLK